MTAFTVHDLAIDPATPTTVYAGTYGGGFKSTDGGTNWTKINSGLTDINIYTFAIDPITTSNVYAGTPSGLWKASGLSLSSSTATTNAQVP
ncbi:MAG: hypothetical protein HQK65_06120 [Desulfamplus sp.]|nr:hypothetical protein [Desulfamplus sp.]